MFSDADASGIQVNRVVTVLGRTEKIRAPSRMVCKTPVALEIWKETQILKKGRNAGAMMSGGELSEVLQARGYAVLVL